MATQASCTPQRGSQAPRLVSISLALLTIPRSFLPEQETASLASSFARIPADYSGATRCKTPCRRSHSQRSMGAAAAASIGSTQQTFTQSGDVQHGAVVDRTFSSAVALRDGMPARHIHVRHGQDGPLGSQIDLAHGVDLNMRRRRRERCRSEYM